MTSETLAGGLPTGRRPRSSRLRRSEDVRAVFSRGRSAHNRSLSVHALRTRDHGTRSTVVAGRKVGNAVTRNRMKRRLRAALQSVRLPEGFDVVIVARSRCQCDSMSELEHILGEQLRRAAKACAGRPS